MIVSLLFQYVDVAWIVINDCSFVLASALRLTLLAVQSSAGHYAPRFGIGALEELDVEDEDIYASGKWGILSILVRPGDM